jgi:hypothetical protein
MFVVMGIDEGHRLTQIDGQFSGNEAACVVADDADLNGSLRGGPGNLDRRLFLILGVGVFGIAGSTVVRVLATATAPSAATRAVVLVAVLREHESASFTGDGRDQQ